MILKLASEYVEVGMYVERFAGRWLSHPFWRARFLVQSHDIDRIRIGCADVFIDTTKGKAPGSDRDGASAEPSTGEAPRQRAAGPAALPLPPRSTPRHVPFHRPMPQRRLIAPAAFGKADRMRAAALAQRSTAVMKAVFEECRLGRPVSTPQIMSVVNDIAAALQRNSAVFASVTRLKTKDDGTYTHSVAVCALMINLAYEAGLPNGEIHNLGMAGLMHDLGKVAIDDAILQKVEALTPLEQAEIRRHPELGHAILAEQGGLPRVALDVCLHHHERLDGSGYPFGLRGDAVSPAARMAAICDVYDAMTSDRPYKKGKLPIEAVTWMDGEKSLFDQGLLFRFMRSIGVFPAGKLVRLRSNRLAVVLPAEGANLRPIVRAFYTTVDGCLVPYEDAILSDGLDHDQAITAEDPAHWFSADWDAMAARIMADKSIDMLPADQGAPGKGYGK